MRFSILLWWICWERWWIRWSCSWHGLWYFCSNKNRVYWWRCSIGRVRTKMSRFQRWSTHRNIFPLKILIYPPSLKISFGTIVLLWPCPAHSNFCNFTNNMARREPVGSIGQTSDYSSGDAEGPNFIWCVDGREPPIHEVLAFGDNGVTREVHPTAWVDVGAGVVREFASYYLTESGRRIPIFGRISINGSVEYFGISDFYRTGGPFWIDNLLATHYSWGDGGITINHNWGSQPEGPSGNVAVLSNRPICVLLVYVCKISENTCVTVHRIRDNHLRINRLAHIRSPSTSRNPLRNRQFDRRDDDWEGPADQ